MGERNTLGLLFSFKLSQSEGQGPSKIELVSSSFSGVDTSAVAELDVSSGLDSTCGVWVKGKSPLSTNPVADKCV